MANKLTKADMEKLRDKYNELVTVDDKRVEKLDTKNRSFILYNFTRLTTAEFLKEFAHLQSVNRKTQGRGRPVGSGKKDKATLEMMRELGTFTINDLVEKVPDVTRVYLTSIANKNATLVERKGRTKVFKYF